MGHAEVEGTKGPRTMPKDALIAAGSGHRSSASRFPVELPPPLFDSMRALKRMQCDLQSINKGIVPPLSIEDPPFPLPLADELPGPKPRSVSYQCLTPRNSDVILSVMQRYRPRCSARPPAARGVPPSPPANMLRTGQHTGPATAPISIAAGPRENSLAHPTPLHAGEAGPRGAAPHPIPGAARAATPCCFQ